tara:strand:+ start:670 stop:1596 length:927 start_codon:yes stop_codon:yes gene_type:complete
MPNRTGGHKKVPLGRTGLPPLAELLIKKVVKLGGKTTTPADVAGVRERLKNATLVNCTLLVKSDSWPSKEYVQDRWGSTGETVFGCDKLEDFILPRPQTWLEYVGPVSGNLTAMTLTETAGGDSYDVDILELRKDSSLFTPVGKSRLAFELFDEDQNGCVGEWSQVPQPQTTLQYNLCSNGHLAALVYCLRSMNSSHSDWVKPSRTQRRAAKSLAKQTGTSFASFSTIRLREGAPSPTLTTTLITMKDMRKQSAEHWVRGHPRRLPDGRKISVKPHKRGNPFLGTIKSSYVVEGNPPKKEGGLKNVRY